MPRYRRLSLQDREECSRLFATQGSLRAIARSLGRAPSSLTRELVRNRTTPGTARAVPAQRRARRLACQPRAPRTLQTPLALQAVVVA